MNEAQAREIIVQAGLDLVASGLIVRTWGNISCRIDGARFAITPKGRAYETLPPQDIAICAIADAAAQGPAVPSSEKAMHAAIYRARDDADFIIHTHQKYASAVASAGIAAMTDETMGTVPVAAYGMPSTKKLARGVAAALAQANGAILMAHHGAVCYGADAAATFAAAQGLEDACERFLFDAYRAASGAPVGASADAPARASDPDDERRQLLDYYVGAVTGDFSRATGVAGRATGAAGKVTGAVGKVTGAVGKVTDVVGKATSAVGKAASTIGKAASDFSPAASAVAVTRAGTTRTAAVVPRILSSRRDQTGFVAVMADGETTYLSSAAATTMPVEARIHAAVYAARPDVSHIELSTDDYVKAVSLARRPLPRYLDDFAQMLGSPMRIAADSSPRGIVRSLRKAGGVLIPGVGALCCAATPGDAHAVRLVTEKNAVAEVCAVLLGGSKPIPEIDCRIMHVVYQKSYSKRAAG